MGAGSFFFPKMYEGETGRGFAYAERKHERSKENDELS